MAVLMVPAMDTGSVASMAAAMAGRKESMMADVKVVETDNLSVDRMAVPLVKRMVELKAGKMDKYWVVKLDGMTADTLVDVRVASTACTRAVGWAVWTAARWVE